MFKAIGFVIVLWALSHYFAQTFLALDDAATASLRAVEAAANLSQLQIEQVQPTTK